MLIWSDFIVSQWPRLITGHGFDLCIKDRASAISQNGRREAFCSLSVLTLASGAAGLMIIVVQTFRERRGNAGEGCPALLAGLVAILTIAILGVATAQIWWVTLIDCDAIAFAILLKGMDGAQRPDIRRFVRIEPEAPQAPGQESAAVYRRLRRHIVSAGSRKLAGFPNKIIRQNKEIETMSNSS